MLKNKKVDFLIAGVQKGGTTALDKYLRDHSDIAMAVKKEIHFFDKEVNFKAKKVDYDKYHSHWRKEDSDKIVGESTPIYIYWNNAIKRVFNYNPEVKIILVLRNPVLRAYSQWNMTKDRGQENLDFSQAIRFEEKRLRKSLPLQNRNFSYVDRGFYSEQVRELYRYFDSEQILILKQEELFHEPNSTLNMVARFLGVKQFETVKHKIVHARKYDSPILVQDKMYLLEKYYYDIKQLERMLGWDCSDWIQ